MNNHSPTPYAAGAAAPPAPRRPPAKRHPVRRLLRWLALALLAALAWLWWWAGSNGSLATLLGQLAQRLPPGQSLQLQGVSGSLRAGGHIDALRWSNAQLRVELRDVRIAWRLAPLLQGRLRFEPLHAAQLTLTPSGAASAPPGEPLHALALPLPLVLPFAVEHITWAGSSPVHIAGLRGSYRYDGSAHLLSVEHVALAQGQYRLQARLQAQAPMALQAQASGTLQTGVPGSASPLTLQALAHVQGTLSGTDARLQASATLSGAPGGPDAGADATAPVHADAQASIAPWAAQPLLQASAVLQALDLAALWPQAPHTALSGNAHLEPHANGGWQINTRLTNARPGPWDRQQLPISALQASARYDGAQWQVPEARVEVGTGRVQLSGSYAPARQALQGQVQLQRLNPALLHSRLAAAPLSGNASASGQSDGAIRFDVALHAAPAGQAGPSRTSHTSRTAARTPAGAPPLRLHALRAQGRWHGRQLELSRLELDAMQLRLRAQTLHVNTHTLAARGAVQLQLPGMRAELQGSLAPHAGDGRLQWQLQQAQATQRWLASLGDWLPRAATLQRWQLQGDARLDARWHGGWQDAARLLRPAHGAAGKANAQANIQAGAFDLQASLASTELRLNGPDGSTPTLLQDAQATLRAGAAQAALNLAGTLRQGAYQAHATASASATRQGAGRWQARLNALHLQATLPGQRAPWTVQLEQATTVALQWAPRLRLQADAGTLRLSGPQPGAALLHWQPLDYAVQADGRGALRSQGTLTDLPLAWANAVQRHGQPLLASLGLGSSVRLAGAWDVDTSARTPRLQASLQRSSGDLQLLLDGSDAPPLAPNPTGGAAGTPAGLRLATLQLRTAGPTLHASLQWDSAQLGTLQAQASTQLTPGTNGADGWSWAPDAPVSASIHAALPELGVWSTLAPPGWRVRGTLAADVRLAGTRAAPQWSGTLAADQFAVRALLEGIDLQDGRLRATLRGQQLNIDEFTLHGGRGSRARIAGYSGNRTAPPAGGGGLRGSGRIAWHTAGGVPDITMDLQAQAQALQLLVRADRQVSVSGTLQAQLQAGQLTLHGNLTTDRATLVLPEAGTPALGSDVVLLRPGTAPSQARPPGQVRPGKPPIIDLRLNLGDDFAVQGYGLTTRLRGQLALQSQAGAAPQVHGEVHTEQGRYRAWGQMLDVETGLLRFSGRYDNPQLDILALRPNINVRAGVQVSGTAQAPRVRLYSEPDMPDAEKLSWVLLGKSAAGGGAEAALMQQAALALLGSQGSPTAGVARSLGLDEIGFKGPQDGQDASSAALTLGKRLSRDLYVSYERSLSGVLGTLYIFYDLTRHLTLRGQTGEQSALDVVYTVRYD